MEKTYAGNSRLRELIPKEPPEYMPMDDAITMIDDILEFREYKLTEWETEFLISIRMWSGATLTDRQTKTLNKIYDKVMR
jgi:hypothetical protein